MPSLNFLTAEMHLVQCTDQASDAYQAAAACRWWHPLRRALLIRTALLRDREAGIWASQLYDELRPETAEK